MEEQEITVEIDEKGEIHIEAAGFKGKGCSIAVDQLSKSLGSVASSKNKAEYYQDPKVKIKQKG